MGFCIIFFHLCIKIFWKHAKNWNGVDQHLDRAAHKYLSTYTTQIHCLSRLFIFWIEFLREFRIKFLLQVLNENLFNKSFQFLFRVFSCDWLVKAFLIVKHFFYSYQIDQTKDSIKMKIILFWFLRHVYYHLIQAGVPKNIVVWYILNHEIQEWYNVKLLLIQHYAQ